jgi:hypothetical protein
MLLQFVTKLWLQVDDTVPAGQAGSPVAAATIEFGGSPSQNGGKVVACPFSGSVSTRASQYSRSDEGRDCSGGLQHTQNHCGTAKEVDPTVVGRDLLIGSGAGTEEVAQLASATTRFATGRPSSHRRWRKVCGDAGAARRVRAGTSARPTSRCMGVALSLPRH